MHTELHKRSPSVVENNKQNRCGVHIYSHKEQKHVEEKYRLQQSFNVGSFLPSGLKAATSPFLAR